jgi:hypothetical protein
MNVEIGTETPIFLFWEYLFRNFGILSLQCGCSLLRIFQMGGGGVGSQPETEALVKEYGGLGP